MASALTAASLSQGSDCMQMFRHPPAGAPMQVVTNSLDLSNDIPTDSKKQQLLQRQDHATHKAGTPSRTNSDRNGSPSKNSSKPGTPHSQHQQPQTQLQQRVLDLRHAGPESQHWALGNSTTARTHSPANHIPQRPAWESSVAAVWGKQKPTELKPAGSAGAGGVLDLTGPDHADSSHWCSGSRRSNGAAGEGAIAAMATPGDAGNLHWATSNAKSSDGSPQLQKTLRAVVASADQAGHGNTADAAAVVLVPCANAAGVKRQLPLGSLVDGAAAGAAVPGRWWTMDAPLNASAAGAGDQVAAANDAAATVVKPSRNPDLHLTEVPASTLKRLKISSAEDDTPTTVDCDCGQLLHAEQKQNTAAAAAATAVEQRSDVQQKGEEDPWIKHQREVQQLKQQQADLQQLLQQAEQQVKAPILREAQLLTMEMQEKVRARGLDSVSLAAISKDVPHIKRTADSDAERVAAHMLAQEGGNWKASLERMMRMVKTSTRQKQLLGLKQTDLHTSSSTASPVNSSGTTANAAAGAAVAEEPLLSQGSTLKAPEQHTPITTHWQRSLQEASPYAAAGGTAELQSSPYAAAAAAASVHNSPVVRQYSTAGLDVGQAGAGSPYASGGHAAAAGTVLQCSGSPYTAGPVGLAGVPQPAAISAAKLQWPMVPSSAVGSPVGSPACSPMVPTSAVGSPLTASTDVNATVNSSGAAAGTAGGFSSLMLPTPVWGGTSAPAAGTASGAAASTALHGGYGSPMVTLHAGEAAGNSSPAAGTRGRSHSPAGNCGRPKLVRQQSRMAPKQPLSKASVAAMTASPYQANNSGGGAAAAAVMPSMLGLSNNPTLAPAGAGGYMPGTVVDASMYAASAAAGTTATAHMQTAVGSDPYGAATEGTYSAAAAMPRSFGSSTYAAMTGETYDAAAAAAMPVPDSSHAYGAVAVGTTATNAVAAADATRPASCSGDAQAAVAAGSQDCAAAATAVAAVYMQHAGATAWNAAHSDMGNGDVQVAHEQAAAAAKQATAPSGAGHHQQQHLTTAAAAAAAFGSVTALTVDTDIDDAGWLFGEGGLLPDTPGPANLLAAQQQHKQQQQQGAMHLVSQQQQQQHQSAMQAVAAGAATAVQHANMEVDEVDEATVNMPLPPPAAAVGPGVDSGVETKPLGTDKDDIALLQMLLGWGSDS